MTSRTTELHLITNYLSLLFYDGPAHLLDAAAKRKSLRFYSSGTIYRIPGRAAGLWDIKARASFQLVWQNYAPTRLRCILCLNNISLSVVRLNYYPAEFAESSSFCVLWLRFCGPQQQQQNLLYVHNKFTVRRPRKLIGAGRWWKRSRWDCWVLQLGLRPSSRFQARRHCSYKVATSPTSLAFNSLVRWALPRIGWSGRGREFCDCGNVGETEDFGQNIYTFILLNKTKHQEMFNIFLP